MPQDITKLISRSKIVKAGSKKPLDKSKIADRILIAPGSKFKWTVSSSIITVVPQVPPPISDHNVITAFDLDGTLINTKSGRKFATGPNDWKWFNDAVLSSLKLASTTSSIVVIFTNQGGLLGEKTSKSYCNFHGKLTSILSLLDLPNLAVYAAPKTPAALKKSYKENDVTNPFFNNRKPQTGLWVRFLQDFQLRDLVDWSRSIYVGDAAGRAQDFSDSDLKFAKSVGLKFQTPEEYFT